MEILLFVPIVLAMTIFMYMVHEVLYVLKHILDVLIDIKNKLR